MTDPVFDPDTELRWKVYMIAAQEAAKNVRQHLEATKEPHDSIRYQNTILMIEILDKMGSDRNFHAAVTAANTVVDTLLTIAKATMQEEFELLNAPVSGKPS